MKTSVLIMCGLLCSACSTAPTILPGQAYVSPMGEFSCRTYPNFGMSVDATFGPHGGTVRLINEIDMTRIDVEELSPTINTKDLSDLQLFSVYEGHLTHAVLPLVRGGVPEARILGSNDAVLQGRRVHLSTILLPGKSNFMFPNGKYADGIRAEVQYTNGKYMYVVSMLDYARPEMSSDKQILNALANVSKVFGYCNFPQ
jgi:hypothetical protein